jgi:preprotein translocase subunit Sec61beta
MSSRQEEQTMPQQKKQEGFHSGAGLIRYFDAEEKTAFKIPPWFVVVACIATIIGISIVHLWRPI